MMDAFLRYTLRMERQLFQKFRYLAGSEGRSANKKIEQYIKGQVSAYEKKFGEIPLEKIKPE